LKILLLCDTGLNLLAPHPPTLVSCLIGVKPSVQDYSIGADACFIEQWEHFLKQILQSIRGYDISAQLADSEKCPFESVTAIYPFKIADPRHPDRQNACDPLYKTDSGFGERVLYITAKCDYAQPRR